MTYGLVSALKALARRPRPRELLVLAAQGVLTVFQLLACNLACLAIASVYYAWRDVYHQRRRRQRLNDRVAYMLWVAANRAA